MKINLVITIQDIKDIFHAVMPIVLMIILPHGWITFGIVYAYIMIKSYVYTFIKNPNNMSVIAIIGLLINFIAAVGYINGL